MKLLSIMSMLFLASICHAADLELLQQTTVDSGALTFADGDETKFGNFPNGVTHQQFPLRTYRGYQYAIYYDDQRQVAVGRRKLPAGDWEVARLTDYNITNNDTHNVAVLGICENDGTIHLTFDHHKSDLHYSISVVGLANDPNAFVWDASLFSPTTNILGPLGALTDVTYPRFISMPNGNLMLYYRFFTSGNGDGMIRVYDGHTSQWTTGRGRFIARDIGTYSFGGATSDFRYSYVNGIGYAGNRLHISWVWRDRFESTNVNNQHDLCYAYSDDDGLTWKNSAGTQIAVTGSSFIHLNSPGLIVHPIDPNRGLANQTTQYAYSDGGMHVMLSRYRDGTTSIRYYHHHWRDAAGNWHVENTGIVSGSRPELLGDDQRNLFLVYTAGSNLRILKGVPNAGRTAWSWSLIYNNSSPNAAGDGQVDPYRWENERVLSAYVQERPSTILDYGSGTPIDGLPTPLRVTDFQVSLGAAEPDPSHEARHVAPGKTLEWTAGLNGISRHVYLGTDSNAVATATTASPEFQGGQLATSYTPASPLAEETTYYWRVDELEAGTVVRTGLLWSFTTGLEVPALMIGSVGNPIVEMNTPTPALPFTVSDGSNPASSLVVSGESSNPLLVPPANIVFGGAGSNRTVSVTPAPGQTGVADLVLSVSNGSETNSSVFRLTVLNEVFQQDVNFGDWDEAVTWNPDGLPAANGDYKTAMDLEVNRASMPFSGDALSIESGGTLRLRDGSNTFFVDNLMMVGGRIYAATQNNITFALDGNLSILSDTAFNAYWNTSGPRNLRILSKISGAAKITCEASNDASTHTVFIDNDDNDFSGTWVSDNGTLEFASAGAVGTAGIEVLEHGKLTIHGNWLSESKLTVADSVNTLIDLGDYVWTNAYVSIGSTPLADGVYSVADLNGFSDAVFVGTGHLVVGVVVDPPVLNYAVVDGDMVFSWSESGFKMQARTNLTEGVWFDLPGGDSSPVSVTPSFPYAYYRLLQQ